MLFLLKSFKRRSSALSKGLCRDLPYRVPVTAILIGSLCWAVPSYAAPTNSPSAKAAARLKKNPPRNWLAHYLPDDRYKIAGGVWKYVSTETDRYYYQPANPAMLRQSADMVIGFPSAATAEEAGYRPSPDMGWDVAPIIARSNARTKTGSSRKGKAGAQASNSQTMTIPVSAIPKRILAFIRLVDNLADRIDGASSERDLLGLQVAIDKVADDFGRGAAASYLGGNRVQGGELGTMIGILQTLSNAARVKINSEGNDVGSVTSKQQTNTARSLARDLIPQVRAIKKDQFKQQVDKNQRDMLKGRRGGRAPV